MRRYASWFSVVGLVLTVFWSTPAHATELIDFGTGLAGAGGHMTYGGAGGALEGTNILIGVMTAVGTPVQDGIHLTTGAGSCAFPTYCAELDFVTGALDSYSNGVYAFKPGGSFTIKGGVLGSGLSNEVLMWGTFTGDSVLDGGQLKFNASGSDSVNPALLSYLGIAPGTAFEFVGSI